MKIQTILKGDQWIKSPGFQGRGDVQLCRADCAECGGDGWVRLDVPTTDPRCGKLVPCSHRDIDSDGYGRKFGLKKQDRLLSWEDVLDLPDSNAVAASRKVRAVLQRGYGWVYLWGNYGNAKSLILQIAAAASLRAGLDSAYVRMSEVMDHLREGYSSGDYGERMDWWKSVPVLCLDEFEKVNEKNEKGMSWVGDKRFVMMDNRYVAATRGDGVTIMAGNVNPKSFEGALWDRIQDGRFNVIHMVGESARPGMTWDDSLAVDRESVFERGERAFVFDRGVGE